jgi:hypothetical protein
VAGALHGVLDVLLKQYGINLEACLDKK